MILNELIIVGGGNSIKEGISLGLKDIIKDKFAITCNFAHRHFDSTLTCFADEDFYHNNHFQLEKLPLIIGYESDVVKKELLPNTIMVKRASYYSRQPLEKGFYRPTLCGLFALTLGSWLINYKGTIFILGYDWTKKIENKPTHYYPPEEIAHAGQGKTKYYDKHSPDYSFKYYIEPNIKIYNVSPESNITTFEKIDYSTMFKLLSPELVNSQEFLRNEIRSKLCTK